MASGEASVKRRHVFYIEGYDPQGVAGYYGLFRRELARFRKLWPVSAQLSEAQIDDDGISARWQIETSGSTWRVDTTYEFLRWDDIIIRDLKRPMIILVPRIFYCLGENLINGTRPILSSAGVS